MRKKTLVYLSVLILLSLFLYRRWLSFDITANSDWLYFYPGTLKDFFNISTWFSMNMLGSVDLTFWRLPLYIFYGIFGTLGYGYNVVEKFIFFWPTLVLSNLASFFLVKKTTKSNLAGFIGAIVFNYNTYYLVLNSAFLLYSAAAWSIITLLTFMKALEKRKLHLFLLSGLILFITSSYDFRIGYITILVLGFYFLFHNLYMEKFKKDVFIKNFLYFSLQGFTFLLLNIYWLLPVLKAHSLSSNTILSRGLFGNEFINVMNAFTISHPFWTGGEPTAFVVQPIMSYFWLVPIFAFLGFWLNRKNKLVLFFGLVSMFGILLTKQVAYPFSGLYDFLFRVLPFFNAFREATKFYFLIALGYSVLIGSFVCFVWKDLKKSKHSIYIQYFLTIIIAFIFLWNTKPLITGEISGIYVPRHIPKDYLIAKKFIDSKKNYFRTLWIPADSTWATFSNNHPIVDSSVFGTNWSNIFSSYLSSNNSMTIGQSIIGLMDINVTGKLMDLASIKYVFIPLEDKANDSDFYPIYGNPRQYYINNLDKLPWLHKINIGTKNLVVYQNYGYRPHLYITNMQETTVNIMHYKTVNYTFVSPSEYKISINNVKKPFYLNFSEAFNSGWRIYLGDFKWHNVFFYKKKTISTKEHFQNNAALNSFYINPGLVCKVEGCKINKDGTDNLNLTLYFVPQSYMYLGLIISGSTLAIVLGYLIVVFGRNIYEKKNS